MLLIDAARCHSESSDVDARSREFHFSGLLRPQSITGYFVPNPNPEASCQKGARSTRTVNNSRCISNRLVEVGSGDGGPSDRGLESLDDEPRVCFTVTFSFTWQLARLYTSPACSASTGNGRRSITHGRAKGILFVEAIYLYNGLPEPGLVGALTELRPLPPSEGQK